MDIQASLQGSLAETIETLQSISILGNSLDQLLLSVLVLVLGWAFARVSTFFLNRYVSRWTRHTKTLLDDFCLDIGKNLTIFVVFVLSIRYAIQILTLTDSIDNFVEKVVIVLLSLAFTRAVLKVFDFMIDEYLIPYANRIDILDATIIPTLNRIVRLVIWSIVFLLIISNLGYDISSLLAGFGIGGIAVALAAQEALSNFFGSISLFIDKTFKVGDFIQTSEIQGTILAVGLRSTRLESVEGTELIVPNSQLAKATIENLSRRPKRRVDLNLGLEYETSNAQMKIGIKLLKEIIEKHKETDKHCRVHFNEFSDSGLNIMLTYWIKDLDFEKGQRVQNEVNLKVKEGFEKAKIGFAYPTRTLYMHNIKK
jgi:MscS family membrane protein